MYANSSSFFKKFENIINPQTVTMSQQVMQKQVTEDGKQIVQSIKLGISGDVNTQLLALLQPQIPKRFEAVRGGPSTRSGSLKVLNDKERSALEEKLKAGSKKITPSQSKKQIFDDDD